MRCLIVEDDFAARRVMLGWLSDMGDCDIAVNGVEAVDAFRAALENGHAYDLIFLDIMMPEMGGHPALEAIRQIESKHRIGGLDSARVIMTTALADSKHIMGAFKEGCEAYIVKPVTRPKLMKEIKALGIAVSQSC